MAGRNSSGTFSSSIADFQTGTVIRSNDVNTVRDEFATEITDSLSRSAKGGMLAALKLYDGSAAIPSLTFSAQEGIGFYRAGNYDLRFVCDAAEKFRLTNLGAKVTGTFEATGNTTVGGTLGVTGATTVGSLASSGAVSGTTGTFTGDVTVDTNVLKVDTTNNRVGVGTASPNALLAVGHAGVIDSGIPVQINAASTAEQYFGVNKGGSLGLLMGYSNAGSLGTQALIRNVQNDPITVMVNSTSSVAEFYTTGVALKTSNPASTTAQTNNLTTTNLVKVHGNISVTDGGVVTVEGGFNIASATLTSAGNLRVVFASEFAAADTYTVTATSSTRAFISSNNRAKGHCDLQITTTAGAANFSGTGGTVYVMIVVLGAQ